MRALQDQRFIGARRLSALLIALALVSLLFGSPKISPTVHAAGLVYVNPPITPLKPIGSNFNVTVEVAGMDPFDGWDIQIQSNPSIINATALSIDGNILAANYSLSVIPLTVCINGSGSSCTPSDVMGVVHSAAVALGSLPPPSSDGLLFTITYRVVGSGTYSTIHILSEKIPAGPNPPVSVGTQDGLYGVPPGQGFKLTASPNSTILRPPSNTNANVTLTVSSLGGYSGIVNLTLATSQSGLSLSLNATTISLSSQPSYVKLAVAVLPAYYNQTVHVKVTVTGTSGGLAESTIVSIETPPPPDFVMGVSPSLLKIHATSSGSSIITLDVDPETGFSGSIHLRMDVPPVSGLIALLGATDFTISPGRPATTVFAVSTPPSDLPFKYLINITASSQSKMHEPFTIIVKSPSPDFTFQIGGPGFALQAGQSRAFTLNMTSVDYFKGQLFLLATSLSGIKEVFTRPSVALDFGNSSTSLMTITTDQYLAPGNHIVNMTALGTTFLGVSVNHTITTTITIIPVPIAKMILGLQPVAYFGIVGVLWMGVIGAAIREIRKPKTKRFLT